MRSEKSDFTRAGQHEFAPPLPRPSKKRLSRGLGEQFGILLELISHKVHGIWARTELFIFGWSKAEESGPQRMNLFTRPPVMEAARSVVEDDFGGSPGTHFFEFTLIC